MNAVLGGILGPLAAVVVTWMVVVRTFRRDPARVTGVMMAAFFAKVVFFAAYVIVMIKVLSVEPTPFVIAFATSFVTLYALEAMLFARLFRQSAGERGKPVQDKQTIDFIGHVANSDPLIHLPPIFGIDMSISKHVLMLWLVALILFVAMTAIVRGYLRRGAMVPTGAANALETIVEYVRDSMVRPNVGDKWVATWTPLLLTFFLFILTANAIGLVPIFEVVGLVDHYFIHSPEDSFLKHLLHGGSTATGNFNVTAGLATITFFAIITAGTLAHGFVKHFKNLVPHGLPAPLYILLVPMELVGMFVRPFALTMRLAANMTGGHIAILAILSFVFIFADMLGPIGGVGIGLGFSVPVAGAVLGLEIIVVLVQAYVFTLLSAVFIGMAIHSHH